MHQLFVLNAHQGIFLKKVQKIAKYAQEALEHLILLNAKTVVKVILLNLDIVFVQKKNQFQIIFPAPQVILIIKTNAINAHQVFIVVEDFLLIQVAQVEQFQMLILQIVKNVLPELMQDQIVNVKFVIEINIRMKVLLNVMIVPLELILQIIILLVLNVQQVLN